MSDIQVWRCINLQLIGWSVPDLHVTVLSIETPAPELRYGIDVHTPCLTSGPSEDEHGPKDLFLGFGIMAEKLRPIAAQRKSRHLWIKMQANLIEAGNSSRQTVN